MVSSPLLPLVNSCPLCVLVYCCLPVLSLLSLWLPLLCRVFRPVLCLLSSVCLFCLCALPAPVPLCLALLPASLLAPLPPFCSAAWFPVPFVALVCSCDPCCSCPLCLFCCAAALPLLPCPCCLLRACLLLPLLPSVSCCALCLCCVPPLVLPSVLWWSISLAGPLGFRLCCFVPLRLCLHLTLLCLPVAFCVSPAMPCLMLSACLVLFLLLSDALSRFCACAAMAAVCACRCPCFLLLLRVLVLVLPGLPRLSSAPLFPLLSAGAVTCLCPSLSPPPSPFLAPSALPVCGPSWPCPLLVLPCLCLPVLLPAAAFPSLLSMPVCGCAPQLASLSCSLPSCLGCSYLL